MMVYTNMEYATCRWNHCDSSSGRNLSFGLMYLRIFLHMGRRIMAPSTERTSPAPLDSHTENVRVFKPASLTSVACLYLENVSKGLSSSLHPDIAYHPSAKSPTCNPWKRTLNNNFIPRVCTLNSLQNPIVNPLLSSPDPIKSRPATVLF